MALCRCGNRLGRKGTMTQLCRSFQDVEESHQQRNERSWQVPSKGNVANTHEKGSSGSIAKRHEHFRHRGLTGPVPEQGKPSRVKTRNTGQGRKRAVSFIFVLVTMK